MDRGRAPNGIGHLMILCIDVFLDEIVFLAGFAVNKASCCEPLTSFLCTKNF